MLLGLWHKPISPRPPTRSQLRAFTDLRGRSPITVLCILNHWSHLSPFSIFLNYARASVWPWPTCSVCTQGAQHIPSACSKCFIVVGAVHSEWWTLGKPLVNCTPFCSFTPRVVPRHVSTLLCFFFLSFRYLRINSRASHYVRLSARVILQCLCWWTCCL